MIVMSEPLCEAIEGGPEPVTGKHALRHEKMFDLLVRAAHPTSLTPPAGAGATRRGWLLPTRLRHAVGLASDVLAEPPASPWPVGALTGPRHQGRGPRRRVARDAVPGRGSGRCRRR